jgi:hypothetical protein
MENKVLRHIKSQTSNVEYMCTQFAAYFTLLFVYDWYHIPPALCFILRQGFLQNNTLILKCAMSRVKLFIIF